MLRLDNGINIVLLIQVSTVLSRHFELLAMLLSFKSSIQVYARRLNRIDGLLAMNKFLSTRISLSKENETGNGWLPLFSTESTLCYSSLSLSAKLA